MKAFFFPVLLSLVSFSTLKAVDYRKDIMPIMKEHCWDCHSGEKYKGNLNLDRLDQMTYHIGKYNIIIPGNSAESSFLEKMLLPEGDADFMPRKGEKLPDAELKKIAKWIDEGAIVDLENPTEEDQKWLKEHGNRSGGAAMPGDFREWTSNDGKVIEARFHSIQGAFVKLVMKNGRAYSVPLERLSAESVTLAKKLAGSEE